MFVICYIYAFLFTIYIQFVTERLHMGGWVAGAQTPASIKHKTYFVHRARRAGRRSRRARRAQASAGSASRAEPGKGENRCRRHALKRWFGSGEVSTDGLQGAQPPASIKHKTYFVLERGERGGAAVRARRARASAGSASRAEPGKGENRFEPSVS